MDKVGIQLSAKIDDTFRKAKRNAMWSCGIAILFAFAEPLRNQTGKEEFWIKFSWLDMKLPEWLLLMVIAVILIYNLIGFWFESKKLSIANSHLGYRDDSVTFEDHISGLKGKLYSETERVVEVVSFFDSLNTKSVKEIFKKLNSSNEDLLNNIKKIPFYHNEKKYFTEHLPKYDRFTAKNFASDIDAAGLAPEAYIIDCAQKLQFKLDKIMQDFQNAIDVADHNMSATQSYSQDIILIVKDEMTKAESKNAWSANVIKIIEQLDGINSNFARLSGALHRREKARLQWYEIRLVWCLGIIAIAATSCHTYKIISILFD